MGTKQVVALGLRLLALWLLVSALQFYGVASALQAMSAQWRQPPWMGIAVVAVFVLVGLAIWLGSGPLARGLMSGLPHGVEARFSPYQAIAVGCILMGLWWMKSGVVPLVILWMRAITVAPEMGQSAMAWLGTEGKLAALSEGLQIGIGLLFVLRSGQIARWILRRVPDMAEAPRESFNVLLRRSTELGLRQAVRPDVMSQLVEQLAAHTDAFSRFGELEELLQYGPNPYTRSAAARAILALGAEGVARARDVAQIQLKQETHPDVVKDLGLLLGAPIQQV